MPAGPVVYHPHFFPSGLSALRCRPDLCSFADLCRRKCSRICQSNQRVLTPHLTALGSFVRRFRATLLLFIALLLILTGCAKPPLPDLPTPFIILQPTVKLLQASDKEIFVRLVAGDQGMIHVLAAVPDQHQVAHIRLADNHVVSCEPLAGNIKPLRLDAAIDREGKLHLLLNLEHQILEGATWKQADLPPWAKAGIKTGVAGFVAGAPDLTWYFIASGKDLGTPVRMDIYGFGGANAGIIWPWFTKGERLVLATDSHSDYWNVVHLTGRFDTLPIAMAADDRGGVHVLYQRTLGGLLAAPEPYYLRLPTAELNPEAVQWVELAKKMQSGLLIHARDVEGVPMVMPQAQSVRNLAVDSSGQNCLLGTGIRVQGEEYTDALGIFPSISGNNQFLTASAGGKAFHAVYRQDDDALVYSLLDGCTWSAPLRIDDPVVSPVKLTKSEAIALLGTDDGRAFVTWATADGLMGRWLQPASGIGLPVSDSDCPAIYSLKNPVRPTPFETVRLDLHDMYGAGEETELQSLQIEVRDLRPAQFNRRTTIGDTLMSYIVLEPPEPKLIRLLLAKKVRELSSSFKRSFPSVVGVELHSFAITTPATMFYWDINVSIKLSISVASETRAVMAQTTERTYLWPGKEIITRVVREALDSLESQVAPILQELTMMDNQ